MNPIQLEEITLVGLSLGKTTTNANGQAAIDCGTLWQKFVNGNYAETIPGKLTNEIVAVYHNYEGDFTQPYSYFIGVKVKSDAEVPEGLEKLSIPEASYQKFISKGVIPECIANSWRDIWNSKMDRAYKADFEVYDHRSKDWKNGEVDIFISVN
jgi:predicted transcriptional regulator YdeE